MKRSALIILVPLAIVLPSGCPSPAGGTQAAVDDMGTAGVVEQKNELFVQQNGGYGFTTNDNAYCGPNGYTLWSLPLAGQQTFTQRDVTLIKNSGNAYAGYGIIFCQYDTGNLSLGETMLVVMINSQQQYSVGEATGSVYTPYTSPTWVQKPGLAKGYGMTNNLKVTRDMDGLFHLSLNGSEVMTFRDGRIPLQAGGGDGYLVVISPQDSFPGTPVTVSYKED
jgi:hypothetical protein